MGIFWTLKKSRLECPLQPRANTKRPGLWEMSPRGPRTPRRTRDHPLRPEPEFRHPSGPLPAQHQPLYLRSGTSAHFAREDFSKTKGQGPLALALLPPEHQGRLSRPSRPTRGSLLGHFPPSAGLYTSVMEEVLTLLGRVLQRQEGGREPGVLELGAPGPRGRPLTARGRPRGLGLGRGTTGGPPGASRTPADPLGTTETATARPRGVREGRGRLPGGRRRVPHARGPPRTP